MTAALAKYEAAKAAIAACLKIDEAKEIADQAEALRVYARQAGDRSLEIDAAEIRLRAERRLGELLIAAKAAGQVSRGQPPKAENCSDEEQFPRVRLADVGIDRKLSMRAQRLGGVGRQAFEAMVERLRGQMEAAGSRVSLDLMRSEDKRERRARLERELGARIEALPDAKYGVIVEDPEYQFEPYSRTSGMDRAPENHYPTSPTAAIIARPVGDLAAEDCAYFLWAPAPMLLDAIAVMAARGFAYRTHQVWVKERAGDARGTGYWFTGEHELLLLGTRGNVPCPAPGTQWRSVVVAPVGRHSEKPEIFLQMIEQYFPTLPKIELNRRGPPRPGWSAWGNEAEPAAPVDGAGNVLAHDQATGEIMPDSPPLEDKPPLSLVERAAALHAQRGEPPPADEELDIPAFLRRTDAA